MRKYILIISMFSILLGCKKEISEPKIVSPKIEKKNVSKSKIEKEEKIKKKKIELFNNIFALKSKLSKNGIGQLGSWKNDELGWYSFTDYYTFGSSSSINGMQNNIAYYINGKQREYANEVKIVLNINNKRENKKALIFFNKIVIKTIKSLNTKLPKGLSKSILNQTVKEFNTDNSKISLELDKSKINTWNFIINSK